MSLDYPGENMLLVPNGEQFETNFPTYGLAVTKRKNKTVVSGIWDNSSASKSGIEIGNEIKSINSIEAGELSSTQLWEMFRDEKTNTIEVEFISERGRQKVNLQREMLLPAID